MSTQQPQGNLDDNDREELILLYEVTVTDIAFFKQQQFAVINYCIVLYASIVIIAFQFLSRPIPNGQIWALKALIVVSAIVCSIVLYQLKDSIIVRRKRLEAIISCFSSTFKRIWSVKLKEKDFTFPLLMTVLFVSSIVSWFLLDVAAQIPIKQ